MKLQGASALRSRLKAIRQVFKPAGRDWADETVRLARRYVPVKTGKGRASIRRKNASLRKASVQGVWYLGIVQSGTKAHDEVPKKAKALRFNVGGNTIFAKKVHKRAVRGNEFGHRAGREALAEDPVLNNLVKLWNEASPREAILP